MKLNYIIKDTELKAGIIIMTILKMKSSWAH